MNYSRYNPKDTHTKFDEERGFIEKNAVPLAVGAGVATVGAAGYTTYKVGSGIADMITSSGKQEVHRIIQQPIQMPNPGEGPSAQNMSYDDMMMDDLLDDDWMSMISELI
jgi:hypothetical protein